MNHLLPKVIATIAFTFLLSPLPALAGPPKPDSIKSAQIKEADGSSGQDTNSGSGIKTGHIQDAAITTSKIADGAVTDAKISGPISAEKISSNGLDADTIDGVHAADLAPSVHLHSMTDISGLDSALAAKADISHNHDGIYQRRYANVLVVSKSGGDFSDPVSAANSITDASANNPYLIKVMPGVYDSGPDGIVLPDYVDLEGSGENTTVLRSGFSSSQYWHIALKGAEHCDIRNVTIEAYGHTKQIYAISGKVTLKHVTAIAYGARHSTAIQLASRLNDVKVYMNADATSVFWIGVQSAGTIMNNVEIVMSGADNMYGIWESTSNPYNIHSELNNVRIKLEGGGQYNTGILLDESAAILRNVTIESDARGIQLEDGWGVGTWATIFNSVISAPSASIISTNAVVNAVNTQIDGPFSNYGQPEYHCLNVFDANFTPRGCP